MWKEFKQGAAQNFKNLTRTAMWASLGQDRTGEGRGSRRLAAVIGQGDRGWRGFELGANTERPLERSGHLDWG